MVCLPNQATKAAGLSDPLGPAVSPIASAAIILQPQTMGLRTYPRMREPFQPYHATSKNPPAGKRNAAGMP